MIAVRAVSKAYGRVQALSAVSFELSAGEALALLGPSGSGKSTLLRLIAGLGAPDAGRIEIDGQVVSEPGYASAPHSRGASMVFQQPALWPHMTVGQNIGFGLSRWKREAARRRTAELLAQVGLAGMADRHPHQLSGGEAQRVALARALAPRPSLLLLDEPLANLDPALVAGMLDLLGEFHAETGLTLLFVAHDPRVAAALCPRALVLRAGQVAQSGTWDEVDIVSISRGSWSMPSLATMTLDSEPLS